MKFIKKITLLFITMMMVCACAMPAFAQNSSPLFGPGMKIHFAGEELMMLTNKSASQEMSFVITTKNGKVIVVDGGTAEDADHLKEVLLKKGGHVDAWFVTHAHSDHCGALAKLTRDGMNTHANGLSVDAVYYNFASPEWYRANEEYRADFAEEARAMILAYGDRAHVVHRGNTFDIDGVKVYVMNDPYLVANNSINNSSIAYRMQIGDSVVQFLGDMGEDVGNMFLADHAGEDLKCSIVQMAHHGQYGVGQNFYQALAPETCLWCAPAWLYEDNSGEYRTKEVRGWMNEMGVKENYCIKDGDQILK